jgi:hypothetical protein
MAGSRSGKMPAPAYALARILKTGLEGLIVLSLGESWTTRRELSDESAPGVTPILASEVREASVPVLVGNVIGPGFEPILTRRHAGLLRSLTDYLAGLSATSTATGYA